MSGVWKVLLTWIICCLNLASDCSSETLLLATDSGIKILEPVTSALTTVHQHPASSVDFRYNKRDVYFISGNQILYSYYSEYTGSHNEPIPIITATQRLVDLAVDWRAFKLYYTGSDTGAIYEAALLGTTIAPLAVMEGATVTDLALDVYDRRFFYIKGDTLYMSYLHLREAPSQHFAFTFTTDPHRNSSASKVAVDHHNREVYVVIYDDEHLQWHLVSTNYSNSYATLVFNGPELAQPFALGVFDGEVLWGSLSHGKYTVYSCKLSPACDIDHLEIVYQSVEAIHDVKFYNALIQTPDPETACEELSCSHNCTEVSRYIVRCSCPLGLSVGPDGNICIEDATGLDVSTLWLREARQLLTTLMDALLTWLSSQSSYITVLILIACVAMLILLICGLCLLTCVGQPKRSVRLSETYDLSETRHRAAACRDSDR